MLKFFRRYCVQLLIAAISLAVYVALFGLFATSIADSCSVMYRTNNINNNEIVFSTVMDNDGECFYNLNGGCNIFTSSEERIVSDIFMAVSGMQYGDNTMLYTGNGGVNTCAVSADVMHKWNLKLGDTITCGGVAFTITNKLMAQDGADENFGHSGVVIFSYNEEVLKAASTFSYIFFTRDGDAYLGLKNLTYTSDLKETAASELGSSFIVILAVCIVTMAVCEFFLYRRYRKNYDVLHGDGVPRFKLYLTIFADTCLKYVLPLVIIAIIYCFILNYYGWLFVLPVLCLLLVMVFISAILSYIYLKGVN